MRKPKVPSRAELIFIPFYCFEIELSDSPNAPPVRVAVDGLSGDSVVFLEREVERAPIENELVCTCELSVNEAERVARDQYSRMLLEHGLRNKTSTTVRSIAGGDQLLYPFWIGYIQKGVAYDFRALDAVSGEVQGVRMRKVIMAALRQLDSN
jgi:hypothetical protein